jgi:hypothetical protein
VEGGSALNMPEIAAWFHAQGYFALAPVSVAQLAIWYVKDGAVEGSSGRV